MSLPHVQALEEKIGMLKHACHHNLTTVTPLHPPKSRERADFKEDEREKEPTVPQKQWNKERPDWQDDEPATGPDQCETHIVDILTFIIIIVLYVNSQISW